MYFVSLCEGRIDPRFDWVRRVYGDRYSADLESTTQKSLLGQPRLLGRNVVTDAGQRRPVDESDGGSLAHDAQAGPQCLQIFGARCSGEPLVELAEDARSCCAVADIENAAQGLERFDVAHRSDG